MNSIESANDKMPGEMRRLCRLAPSFKHGGEKIKAGVTTDEINTWVHRFIVEHDATPSPLNYHGFPKSVCTSVNECVCHGIPELLT
ncbi:MAG: M24 family metallopeptidase [Polyangiales bacterium]